jgi:hypothetical protein
LLQFYFHERLTEIKSPLFQQQLATAGFNLPTRNLSVGAKESALKL